MTNRHNIVMVSTLYKWKVIENLNKYSIDAGGIGEALKRSAASLSDADTSLEKSVALITASNSVLMNPEKVGRLLPTLNST